MTKIALVTGGNSGIGYATAKLLKEKDYEVFISGRNANKVQQAAEELDVQFIIADMSVSSNIEQLASHFLQTGIDVLVNNAGIPKLTALEDVTREDFLEIVDVNIWGYLYLIKQLLPALRKRKGCVTNISSLSATRGVPRYSLYALTKGAVEAFTRSIAAELAPDIRVNAVAPGPINTPILGKVGINLTDVLDPAKQTYGHIPLKRMGESDEVAHVVLAQLEATYATGSVWSVDGGVGMT
jgi:NAD(P)-dependent dehydrogenase (short-subunit alcohol dehydrogenase family)